MIWWQKWWVEADMTSKLRGKEITDEKAQRDFAAISRHPLLAGGGWTWVIDAPSFKVATHKTHGWLIYRKEVT